MPRSTRRPSPRTGGPISTRSRAVTRQVRGPLEHRPATRQEIVPAARKRRSRGWLEPSARSDSGQSRGGFSEQTHGRTGYFEVVGGCGDRCRGRPDDSDHGWPALGWISSIVSVSAPLMGPEDRMVAWITGTRFLDKWVSGPSGAAIFWRATSLVWVSTSWAAHHLRSSS